jgi:hypothetical protein
MRGGGRLCRRCIRSGALLLLAGGALAMQGGTLAAASGSTGQPAGLAPGRLLQNAWVTMRVPASAIRVGRVVVFDVTARTPPTRTWVGTAYALDLSGGWKAPWLVIPGGTTACGGDRVPFLRRAGRQRWMVSFGSCQHLGVATWATRAGRHTLSLEVFRIPIDGTGQLLYRREQQVKSATVRWEANVH